jgi:hypothetical protein
MTPYDAELARELREHDKRRERRINNRHLRNTLIGGWLSIQSFFQSVFLALIGSTSPHPQLQDYLLTAVIIFFAIGVPSAFGLARFYDEESST